MKRAFKLLLVFAIAMVAMSWTVCGERTCDSCGGSGSVTCTTCNGSPRCACIKCGGSGQVEYNGGTYVCGV